jgi:hypothetical protein
MDQVPKLHALLWHKKSNDPPRLVEVEPSRTDRKRHLRKYAEGALGDDRSFYFRGPEGKLNLRAHNLILFTDLADGVDEETWLFHWGRGDVSKWIRTCVKDAPLADRIVAVEREVPDDAASSRRLVRELIEETYTLPAEAGSAGNGDGAAKTA